MDQIKRKESKNMNILKYKDTRKNLTKITNSIDIVKYVISTLTLKV